MDKSDEEKDLKRANEELYEIQQIIGKFKTKGRVSYKVRWKGYGSEDDTWEPIENLSSCLDMLEEYDKKQNEVVMKRAEERRLKMAMRKGRLTTSESTDSNSPYPPTFKNTFWKELEAGRVNVFDNDMYSKVKKRAVAQHLKMVSVKSEDSDIDTETFHQKKVKRNLTHLSKGESKFRIRKKHKSTTKKARTDGHGIKSIHSLHTDCINSNTNADSIDGNTKLPLIETVDSPRLPLTETVDTTKPPPLTETVDTAQLPSTDADVNSSSDENSKSRIHIILKKIPECEMSDSAGNKYSCACSSSNYTVYPKMVKTNEVLLTSSSSSSSLEHKKKRHKHHKHKSKKKSSSQNWRSLQNKSSSFGHHSDYCDMKESHSNLESEDLNIKEPKGTTQDLCLNSKKPKGTTQDLCLNSKKPKGTTQDLCLDSKKPKGTTQDLCLNNKKPIGTTQDLCLNSKKPKGTTQDLCLNSKKPKGTTQDLCLKSKKPKGTTQDLCPSHVGSELHSDISVKCKSNTTCHGDDNQLIKTGNDHFNNSKRVNCGNQSPILETVEQSSALSVNQCSVSSINQLQMISKNRLVQSHASSANIDLDINSITSSSLPSSDICSRSNRTLTNASKSQSDAKQSLVSCDSMKDNILGAKRQILWHGLKTLDIGVHSPESAQSETRTELLLNVEKEKSLSVEKEKSLSVEKEKFEVGDIDHDLGIELDDLDWELFEKEVKMDPITLTNDVFSQAVGMGDYDLVKSALMCNGTYDLENPDSSGKTLLMWSVHHGFDDISGLLVEYGAKLNAQMKNGMTPLMLACQCSAISTVNLLLQLGAKVNMVAHDGHDALMIAVKRGENQIVWLLLECGANFNHTSPLGHSAMSYVKMLHFKDTENILSNHINRVMHEYDKQVSLTLNNTAKITKPLFAVQLFNINEDDNFDVVFHHSLKPPNPGVGFLLFIGHAMLSNQEVKCRLIGPCAVRSVTLNGQQMAALTQSGNFVLTFTPLINGSNVLKISTLRDPEAKMKLIVCAYRTQLTPC